MVIGTDILQLIGSIAAAGGLIFTGITFYRNMKEQKKSNRVRELQLLESTYGEIAGLEKWKYEQDLSGKGNEEFYQRWFQLFFNRIEWLSFLINHEFLEQKELVSYFRGSYMVWYEA